MTTLNHPRGRHLGRCDECGKCCYPTRAAAKAAMKADGNARHARTYRCGQWFHYGRKPAGVIRGDNTFIRDWGPAS